MIWLSLHKVPWVKQQSIIPEYIAYRISAIVRSPDWINDRPLLAPKSKSTKQQLVSIPIFRTRDEYRRNADVVSSYMCIHISISIHNPSDVPWLSFWYVSVSNFAYVRDCKLMLNNANRMNIVKSELTERAHAQLLILMNAFRRCAICNKHVSGVQEVCSPWLFKGYRICRNEIAYASVITFKFIIYAFWSRHMAELRHRDSPRRIIFMYILWTIYLIHWGD